jgi:hypothetical protein
MSELTDNDYRQILEYYKKPIPKSARLLKLSAERILAEKLCRCIKKVDNKNEARAIGICTKAVINRKGFTRGKFECKKKESVVLKKNKSKMNKTNKINFKKNITYKKK